MVTDSMREKEASRKKRPHDQGPGSHGQAQEYGVFFYGLKIEYGSDAGNDQQDEKAKGPVNEDGEDSCSFAFRGPLGDVVGFRNISANGTDEDLVKENPEKNQGLDFKESVIKALDSEK